MKIGVDLKPFYTGSKFRGIGMYSRSLIKKMLQYGTENEYHFLSLYGEYEGDPELSSNCYVHIYETGPKIVDVGERQLLRDATTMSLIEAEVKHFLLKSDIDIMLFTSPTEYGNMYKAEWFEGVKKVAILYDLIPLVFPKQCLFNQTYSEDYYESLEFLKSMDVLLAISQSAKDDAVKLLGIDPDKIVVIYAGIDSSFSKLEKVNMRDLKKKYFISDSFILFAGGIDFKKNIEDLIVAYSKCEKSIIKNYQLVITGKASKDVLDKYLGIAKDCGIEDRVICTGYVPLHDLIELYNITDLLVFPSLYEGFGLPVIEAMACGARVLTSDSSSLKEIAEGHGTLVNPKSIKSITKGIEYVFNNPAETKRRAEESIDYAREFTWDKVAKKVLDVFSSMNLLNVKKYNYCFEPSDKLLHNIANLYVEQRIQHAESDFGKISNEIYSLQEKDDKPIINGNNRVLYDVTVVREWLKANYSTGIGRVSKELLKCLKKITYVTPIEVVLKNGDICLKKVNIETWDSMDEIVIPKNTDIYFMPELQLRGIQVERNQPPINMLRKKGVKCYAVVYDILPLRMPQYFEEKTSKAFDGYLREIVDNYDGILCDSKFVDDDVINYCMEHEIHAKDGHELRVGYFHLGANSFTDKKEETVSLEIKRFMKDSKVFLMLGTIEPRKGHKDVLEAFELLWESGFDYKLCIAGHVGWNMNEFIDTLKNHPEHGKRLCFFEAVSDSEVKYLYQNSVGLIQASYGEGYGLPLIEAGHYGVPILCSDIEVFHEVAGENAVYFKPHDIQQLQNKIKEFVDLIEQQKVPDSRTIKGTSWGAVAEKVFKMLSQDEGWYKKLK